MCERGSRVRSHVRIRIAVGSVCTQAFDHVNRPVTWLMGIRSVFFREFDSTEVVIRMEDLIAKSSDWDTSVLKPAVVVEVEQDSLRRWHTVRVAHSRF